MICPRFNNMFGIKRILANALDGKSGIRSADNDRVYAVSGPERKGKSHLMLNMFDHWYVDLLKVKDYGEEFIRYFGANKKEFVNALAEAPKFYMVDHDEALKDLYARDAISSFNKDLNKAYYVIGGKNLCTLLAVQSIMDLDPNFRRRRISGMFHVFARGRVSYYGKAKLSKLIPALMRMTQNNARPDPRNARDEKGRLIRPDFTDTFPKYSGPLLARYLERKNANMEGTVKDLQTRYGDEELVEDKRPVAVQIEPEVKAMMATGRFTKKKIADTLGVSTKTVGQACNNIRKKDPHFASVG